MNNTLNQVAQITKMHEQQSCIMDVVKSKHLRSEVCQCFNVLFKIATSDGVDQLKYALFQKQNQSPVSEHGLLRHMSLIPFLKQFVTVAPLLKCSESDDV